MNGNSDRIPFNDWWNVPIGLKPDGSFIISYFQLPDLATPTRVVIGQAFIEIDGWIIAYHGITKKTLTWLVGRFDAWLKADPSEANQMWFNAIMDALQNAIYSGV